MDYGSPLDPERTLARAPLFKGLKQNELELALQIARLRRLERQDFFFHQDTDATTFYVIIEGRVRLSQLTPEGHQVILRFLGPGDGMGIIVALSNTTYPVSAEAVTDCSALSWNRTSIVELMEQLPRLAVNAMLLVTERFHDLQNRYRELATERVERRVARALLRLTRQAGQRSSKGILLDIPLTRQDLAEMTGTTLFTVSRTCSKWENDGLIETGRGKFIILRPHDLVTIAEDLPTPAIRRMVERAG
jgi:CRP-like cAMP-binding protein